MRHNFYLALLLVFSLHLLKAQADDAPVIKPQLLDKSVLSGIGLKKIDIKDEPEKDFHQKNLYRGEDISIYVVSTETWNNTMDNFPFDEFVYMFHGEAVVKPQSGPSQLFYSGDYFFAPKGYTGEWEILAGNNLHYELSIITTKRADASLIIPNAPHQLFSRSMLSGAHIDLSEQPEYHQVLQKGAELTISLRAEKPMEKAITTPAKEMMVQLLSGQLTLWDNSGQEQVFYTGDFFVIPKGFTGRWKTEGHGYAKYLTVEKTAWN